MASHEVQSNEQHLLRTYLRGRLHKLRFLLTYSSYPLPEEAKGDQIPALEVEAQVP